MSGVLIELTGMEMTNGGIYWMSKSDFFWIMSALYRGYYELTPDNPKAIEVIGDLLDVCINLLAGFDKELSDNLSVYILTHPEFNKKEIKALYDFYIAANGELN